MSAKAGARHANVLNPYLISPLGPVQCRPSGAPLPLQ